MPEEWGKLPLHVGVEVKGLGFAVSHSASSDDWIQMTQVFARPPDKSFVGP